MTAAPSPWRERLASPVTWLYAATALLLAVALVLAIRLGFDWAAINSRSSQAEAAKQVQLAALEVETAPLRGLDTKLEIAGEDLSAFYQRRIPPSYSAIASQFDALAVQSGVRLSRVQYTQGAPGDYLTEISMDAGISGEYPQIMRFVNSLERSPTFFIIRAMSLTGQSGGLVNLRLRVSTWLRPADAYASGLPTTADKPAAEDNAGDEDSPRAAAKPAPQTPYRTEAER